MARSIPSRFISELPKKIINENIEGNLGADVSSYNQIDFDLSSNNSHMARISQSKTERHQKS